MQLKVFFKYRKLYMGVAALLLVVYHGRDLLPAGRFRELLSFFYGTVDFFLFCSGIGCFFSYTSDRDPAAFLKRRVRRLYPIYLAFMAYWLYGFLAADGIALPDILGNLLCVQWLTGREPVFNWYMSALLVTYLLTPALAALAEWADSRLKALGALLGTDPAPLRALFSGALELSGGLGAMAGLPLTPSSLALAAGLLGWGGLCVHLQSAAAIQEAGLRIKGRLWGKLLHGVLSAGLMYAAASLLLRYAPPM